MKPYELVLLVQASLTSDEKQEILDAVIDVIGKDSIKQTDDIGVMKSAYPLMGKKSNTHMHMVSYYLELDPTMVNICTQKFSFIKGLMRHFFYVMKPNEVYLTYSETQKKIEKLIPKKEEKLTPKKEEK